MSAALWASVKAAPKLSDAKSARRLMSELADEPALAPLLEAKHFRALMEGLADHSPYLWQLASSDPKRLAWLVSDTPEHILEALLAKAKARCRR